MVGASVRLLPSGTRDCVDPGPGPEARSGQTGTGRAPRRTAVATRPELGSTAPPRQLPQLVADQGPVPDQLILIQFARHAASGSPASTAATRPPQTQRSG